MARPIIHHSDDPPQFVQVEVADVEHQQFIVYADWSCELYSYLYNV